MTSKIKVDNIENQCGGAVVTKCGGTTTITGTNVNATTITGTNVVGSTAVKSNAIQASDGGNLVSQSGTTITLGASGDTITLAAGASQSGFGRSGSVNWQTTPKTATFTAADGEGYFINSGSAITMNLPAGSAGAIVAVSDYARNFATYNLTISANGSEKIGGIADDATLAVNGQAASFVYVDATKGWVNVQNAEDTETGTPPFIAATGGTITESGNFRIHTFTGPGTFQVTKVATSPPAPAYNTVSYLVAAGGGSGGGTGATTHVGGGGGAGGFREYKGPEDSYTASPLNGNPGGTAITVTATSYPIVVGGGGTSPGAGPATGGPGNVSTFSTVTSTGGGGGGSLGGPGPRDGANGGSGGGGSSQVAGNGGSGNTPPTTPSQGNNGGGGTDAPPDLRGGAGGGATAVGGTGTPVANQAAGGTGATTSITASPVGYSGGGGSGATSGGGPGVGGAASSCGSGAAGAPGSSTTGPNAPDNRAGGGGGAGGTGPNPGDTLGGNGGSGVVIIRYRYQ